MGKGGRKSDLDQKMGRLVSYIDLSSYKKEIIVSAEYVIRAFMVQMHKGTQERQLNYSVSVVFFIFFGITSKALAQNINK